MNRKFYLLGAFIAICASLFAQNNVEDVVYLKNGSVLRGTIVEQKLGESLKIELLGGSVFVFKQAEIDSIKKEHSLKSQLKRVKNDYFRRNSGFRNMTEFGVIYGPGQNDNNSYSSSNSDDFGISIHTVNGYQWWPYLYTGAGVGIDRFISYKQTFSPFYLRLASEFLKNKVTPYVFFDAGYSVMWKEKNTDYITTLKDKGGLYLSAGGGIRIYTHSRASVILSIAYKRNSSETQWRYTYYEGQVYDIKRTYQRMVMNVGVTF